MLARKVITARADSDHPGCMHLTTETVHPWDLFAAITIVAQGASPYTHTYRFDGTNPVEVQGKDAPQKPPSRLST